MFISYLAALEMAAKRVEADIISRETIKPSSPTPHHLKYHKNSLLDQLAMRIYVPIMFLYEYTDHLPSEILKKSLSETLTRYYPFAGRLTNDGLSIDCNDHGVVFVEAQIKCRLLDFLHEPHRETQTLLFPEGFFWKDEVTEDCSLLALQVSYFDCGGVAISICISHKIADGATISTFLKDWADATSHDQSRDIIPAPANFIAQSVLQLDLPVSQSDIKVEQISNCITKRFVFDGSKISVLKKSICLDTATRVQTVTALLYKCAIASSLKKSVLVQSVNMRGRVSPSLPEYSIGNFSWFHTIAPTNASIKELVIQLQNGIRQVSDKNQHANDWLLEIEESTKEVKMLFDDTDIYRFSSLCSWPFYQMDFGRGKPKWVSMADLVVKNSFMLFDTPDGDGIEAVVSLEEEDMKVFQQSEELLAFATIK